VTRAAHAAIVAAVAVTIGCDPRPQPDVAPRLGGGVIAIVDSTPIRTSEVVAYAREHGVSPREALTAVENDVLVARSAERSGIRIDDAVLRKRILSQLVLQRVERENGPETVTESQVDSYRSREREAMRRESLVAPPPPPDESEVTRRATEAAVVARRHEAVVRILVERRRVVPVEVRESTVAEWFGRDAMFEGIR